MKAFRLIVLITFIVVFISAQAFALNEVFKIETSGTEYCGDYNAVKFNAKNNVDLWVFFQNETDGVISFTPNFQSGTTFPMAMSQYLISKTRASFTGIAYLEDQSFITIWGTTTIDKAGTVKALRGTFIQRGVLRQGCFSSGTFSSNRITSLLPCTYIYGEWEACQPNGTQTRTVISTSPDMCAGVPILSQACTYLPPSCSYIYSNWSACLPEGIQTRTVISISPDGCIGTPELLQSCDYIPPALPKTWTVYPIINVIGAWFNSGYSVTFFVELTTDPINNNIYISMTNLSEHSYNLYLRNFQFAQGTKILDGYYGNLSFAGSSADFLTLPAGQTRDGYIINIPSWFNFNEGFTFVFDSENVFPLAP